MEGLVILALYVLGGLLLVGLGVLLYVRAAASRKAYVCPECGERMTVELMKASRCNTCGAPLGGSLH